MTMPKRVSARTRDLEGSVTLAVATRARELRAEGRDIISFAAGEPDFPTPEHILAAASRAVHDPANHHYTANTGLAPLKEAIAENTQRYSGVEADPSHVLVTNGAKQAIYNTCAALLDPGDEVLVPTPFWVTYPASIHLAGGAAVPIPTNVDDDFKVTVSDLEAYATEKTKALVMVSPGNPSGSVYTVEELAEIGRWAADSGVWVIADEIYQRLSYHEPVAPAIGGVNPNLENLVMVNGVAKSYAMTGWRVGWIVGPTDVVDAAARLHSHATGNVANISQQAALAALTGPQDTVEEMRQAFDRRRKLMHAGVSAMSGIECHEPAGAFYVFPDVSRLLGGRYATSQDLALDILETAGVAVVAGESFGTPGYLRFSYALGEDEIERGLTRIAALIESV
jgi:aspartate/methionine/tyrosine aminotransferase